MSAGKSDLRQDAHRVLLKLDNLANGSIVVDAKGDAWQKSSPTGYWYRAYDGDDKASWEVAQRAGHIQVLRDAAA
jgi:hypothetical protein